MDPLPEIPPGKLEDIIGHLQTYKANILNRSSLTSQDPNRILEIKALLSKKGSSIISFLRGSNSFVKDESDSNLNELLVYLNNTINEPLTEQGQDPRYSTIIRDYVDKLFIQFPLTPTLGHIDNLTKSNY